MSHNDIAMNGFIPLVDENPENKDDDTEKIIMEALRRQNQKRKRSVAVIQMSYDDDNVDKEDEEEPEENVAAIDQTAKAPKANKAQRLNEAVMSGDHVMATKLLDQKVDVNTSDSFGRTPLQNAILKGDFRMVKMFLDARADVTHRDDRGDTPLHFAARAGSEQILQELVQRPECEVNAEGSSSTTPLHIAANLNKPELCQILLEHNARFDSREEGGKTPLGKAMESGSSKSAKYLLEYVIQMGMDMESFQNDADTEGNTLLHLAVDSGFQQTVELCLEYGSRIRQPKRNDRSTAFHLACEQGASEIVQVLLSHDPSLAKILLVDAKGSTPLHKAAMTNNASILDLLIEQGASVNARNNDNHTPIMIAASRGATDSVRLLMERGADLTIKDVDGRTAVFKAVGHGTTMEILLHDPALVPLLTEKDTLGYAPPHYAAQRGDVKSINLFLAHNKSTASVLSDAQDTPLHVAARHGWHEIVRALLDKQGGKIVNLQNIRARTALHFACRGGHHKATAILLDHGATIEKDQSNRTPLHEAAKKGSKKSVELIVAKHIRYLNAVDDDKNTALHVATMYRHAHMVTYLLSLDQQEILMNSSNQNILDMAMDMDITEVAMAIADHDRWREVLESCNASVARKMIKLVENMPLVTERILDQCVVIEGDPMSKDYKITYDMSIALSKSDPNNAKQKGSLRIMKTMAEKRREKCLKHPLCFIILSTKWNTFGWISFMLNLLFYLIYIVPLSFLHVELRAGDMVYCPINATTAADIKECFQKFPRSSQNPVSGIQVLQSVIAILTGVLLVKEIVQLVKEFRQYITSLSNYMELVSYIAAMFSVLPTCECKWGRQKTAGAVALFFGWISLILFVQKLPSYGKYVIMLSKMFVTLLKVMLLVLLFALSFGITFHLLMYEDAFATLPTSLMEMFIMMLGEMNYGEKFVPWSKLSYPILLNIMTVLFCLTMPIILMNMLVGLSVGDIDKIEESAVVDRYIMQVELLNDIEDTLPNWLLKRVQIEHHIVYPNRPSSALRQVFNAVIGFGDSEEDEKGDEDGSSPAITAITEKLEEHSMEIEEMHTTLRQMYQWLREQEANRESSTANETNASTGKFAVDFTGLKFGKKAKG